MFQSIFRSVASSTATTKFEKARLQATYKSDAEPPNEKDLAVIMNALKGKDHETKPDMAYNMFIAKLQSSDSRGKWNYLVKNLVILDRMVEERRFMHEVSELELDHVENFKDPKTGKKIDQLVSEYYKYLKAKARLYADPRCSLNCPKTQKKEFFKKLTPRQILEDSKLLDCFIDISFNVAKTGNDGHLKHNLNQYVFVLLLSTLIDVYSTQYMAMIVMIDKFFDLELDMAKECLQCYKRFLSNTEEIVRFTNNHQFIKAFQLSLNEFNNRISDTKMIKAMEEYIKLLETKDTDCEVAPLDIKFNELEFEQLEEECIRISNTWESKNIAEEVAREYGLKLAAANSSNSNNPKSPEFADDDDAELRDTPETVLQTSSSQPKSESYRGNNYHPERYTGQSLPARLESPPKRGQNSLQSENYSAELNSDDPSPWLSAGGIKPPQQDIVLLNYLELIKLNEPDELFDKWTNFYNEEFTDAFESLYKEYLINLEIKNVPIGEGFGEPIAQLKPRDDRIENLFPNKWNDFDAALFESHKNTYSKEYSEEAATSKTAMIWNAATSFFKRS